MKCNIFIAEWWSLDFLYCYLQLFANKLFAPFFLCTVSHVAAANVAGLSCCCPTMMWADGIVKLCKLTSKSCDCAEGLAACWVPPGRWDGELYPTKARVYCAVDGPQGEASVLTFVCILPFWFGMPILPFLYKEIKTKEKQKGSCLFLHHSFPVPKHWPCLNAMCWSH